MAGASTGLSLGWVERELYKPIPTNYLFLSLSLSFCCAAKIPDRPQAQPEQDAERGHGGAASDRDHVAIHAERTEDRNQSRRADH